MPPPAPPFRPGLTPLEAREVPAGLTESFEQTVPPALPGGWQTWASDPAGGYATTKAVPGVGPTTLAAAGKAGTRARAWVAAPQPADAGVAVWERTDGPAGVEVLARGQDLGTGTPSYLAGVVAPGARQVDLVEVKDGVARTVATVQARNPDHGVWMRVTVQPAGAAASVRVLRPDTGEYLNAQGAWQTAPADAVRGEVTHRPATGLVGVGRAAGGGGVGYLDEFTVLPAADLPVPPPPPPPPTDPGAVREAFDAQPLGALPADWRGWSSDKTGGFRAAAGRSVSPPAGLASDGASTTAARAWVGAARPADVQASAAVFLDGRAIPGTVLVRGADLDTPRPTYYGLTASRGMYLRLSRFVGGNETVLAEVSSKAYTSGVWAKLTLTAVGDRVRAVAFRPDTGRWLAADGTWADSPQAAVEVTDGGIRAGGFVGVGRPRYAAGVLAVDDFEAAPAAAVAGPGVTVTASQPGRAFAGDVTFKGVADPSARRVEFVLDGRVKAAAAGAAGEYTLDTTLIANGGHTLDVRALDAAGNAGVTTLPFTAANPNPTPPPARPELARKLPHIRIAQLAYAGNPLGAFEKGKLRDAVDLVIPNPQFMPAIDAVAPTTPQLLYTNLSNLYQGLLTSWLNYADRTGAPREAAFLHVSAGTPFTGSSPSSRPVNQFWAVWRGPADGSGTQADLAAAATGGRLFGVTFGAAGEAVAVGAPDRFREVNLTLTRAAGAGWRFVYEYPTAVGKDGAPTAWAEFTPHADTTDRLTKSGQLLFDPPAGWVPARVGTNPDRLFYVRVRTTSGPGTIPPDARTVLGRDYVGANGKTQGTLPAFDPAADKDGDGYLTDAEYAGRAAGKDARFAHESRLFFPLYGQMRFATNVTSSAVRRWAAEYHRGLLREFPLADGLFVDNSNGRLPVGGTPLVEPTAGYAGDYATLIGATWAAVAPKVVFGNTSGGFGDADPGAGKSTGTVEEFQLRPVEATWSQVLDSANLVRGRLAADSPSPYVVLDTNTQVTPTTDPRTRLAALAYYYQVADPDRTMLMFFGGLAPGAAWADTWVPAAEVDVGRPAGPMRVWAQGADPQNPALGYQVFGRDYDKALVLFKPRSYTLGRGTGTLADGTATTHPLGGTYRPVNADGTVGAPVTQVTLRNGEGAVLLRA